MTMRRMLRYAAVALLLGLAGGRSGMAADNQIFIEVEGRFSGFARVLTEGGIMRQTLALDPGPVKGGQMRTGELVIARPLGDNAQAENRTWFEWRQDFSGHESFRTVRVDIYTDLGKGPVFVRSLWLRNAWPQNYAVVEVDEPADPPAKGKFPQTVFEEVLTIKFWRVHLTQIYLTDPSSP